MQGRRRVKMAKLSEEFKKELTEKQRLDGGGNYG